MIRTATIPGSLAVLLLAACSTPDAAPRLESDAEQDGSRGDLDSLPDGGDATGDPATTDGDVGDADDGPTYQGIVSVVVDEARAATATIPRSGGRLAVTTADGTELALAVPAGALLADTEITLTPISAVNGSPFAGPWLGAVRFAPAGLRFLAPVELTVTAPGPVTATNVVGFKFEGDGTDFHLAPAQVNDQTVSVEIWHFSGAGAVNATPEEIAEQMALSAPEGASQLEQEQASGASADALAVLLRSEFDNAVRPALVAAETAASEDDINAALSRFAAWRANAQRVGGYADLATRTAEGLTHVVVALKRAIELANARCRALDDWRVMGDVLAWFGQAQRDGLDTAANGLDYETVIAGSCLQLSLDVTFPETLQPGPMALSVTAGYLTGGSTPHLDPPLTLSVSVTGGSANPATGDTESGAFSSEVTPSQGVDQVEVEIEACFNELGTSICKTVSRDARAAFTLEVLAKLATDPGELGTAVCTPNGAYALVAGVLHKGTEPASGKVVQFQVSGGGSLASSSATTNAAGQALVAYQGPASGSGIALVEASFSDNGDDATGSLAMEYGPQIAITPTPPRLAQGQPQQFEAAVRCTTDTQVTWSATGGTITEDGLFTAGGAAGAYTVTATVGTTTVSRQITGEVSNEVFRTCEDGEFQINLHIDGAGTVTTTPPPKAGTTNVYCVGDTVAFSLTPEAGKCFYGWGTGSRHRAGQYTSGTWCDQAVTGIAGDVVDCYPTFSREVNFQFTATFVGSCHGTAYYTWNENDRVGRTCGHPAVGDTHSYTAYGNCACVGTEQTREDPPPGTTPPTHECTPPLSTHITADTVCTASYPSYPAESTVCAYYVCAADEDACTRMCEAYPEECARVPSYWDP